MAIRVIHSLFFYLLVALSFIVGSTATLAASLFARSKTRPFQVVARHWARFLMFFSGIKVKVSGLENIPANTPVIFASNHQGAMDIFIVLACLPKNFRFAIKKELFKVPFFGWYLKQAGYFSIDRQLILSAYKTVEKIIEIVKDGESILIFPEGTRSKTGELGKFRRGSLLAALKSGAPIVPIAISGSFNIMPKGTYVLHPCPVKFSVGKPIYITSEADYDGKVEAVRRSIAEML